MRIIDFHTHAFPDELAESTVPELCRRAGITPALDGKISSLLGSMDRLGIETAVVLTVATRPAQFDSILRWCVNIASERLVPFASVHPDDPDALRRIERIRSAGLRGIKFHPYYQGFVFDEARMMPLYERIAECGLILVAHTGFDLDYPWDRIADAPRVMAVARALPELKLVTTHIGGWRDWDQVEAHIIGRPVYMEISYSLPFLPPDRARQLLRNHPPEYLLFGSDAPWGDQEKTLAALLSLGLGEELNRRILHENAVRLLGTVS
jgi:predicted TIM-barrel fold metal-dependent hydrolase